MDDGKISLPVDPVRRDRDRFVAFSFAAADLLLEVGADNIISYASGAARAVSGHAAETLVGQPYELLFEERDRLKIRRLIGRLQRGGRLDPIAVHLSSKFGNGREMVLGACHWPGTVDEYYLTLSLPRTTKAEDALAAGRDPVTGLLDPAAFEQCGVEILRAFGDKGLRLTLLRLPGLHALLQAADIAAGDKLLAAIGSVLRGVAVDKRTAGRLGEEHFGVVHSSAFDATGLDSQIAGLVRGATIERTDIDLAPGALNQEEAGRALVYIVAGFGKSAGKFALSTLPGAFQELLQLTLARFTANKSGPGDRCALSFQPIVHVGSGALRHYEVLTRVEGGTTAGQEVSGDEELGVVEQFDLAVTRRAIEYLATKGKGAMWKLAVNLSAQSLENCLFVNVLLALISHVQVKDRLMFEVSQSSKIRNFRQANAAIQRVREHGFKVGLDEFAGITASFGSLQLLVVDFVKIDVAYMHDVMNDFRAASILKTMCALCRELGMYTIAEMIENREQLDKLRKLGVECGQGSLIAEPAPEPTEPPPLDVRKAAAPRPGRA
jgi:EAL domain-containing protein (putative c-di-GMP-specific phosphodiesterase class I)